jgi:hypothetical protein
MALTLQTIPSAQGVQWVRKSLQLFFMRPIAFSGLFAMFIVVALLLSMFTWVGAILALASLPLLSLGFMIASESVLAGGAVLPSQFVLPLRGRPERRKALLMLCALYAGTSLLSMLLCDALDGGSLDALQRALAKPGAEGKAAMEAALADPRLVTGVVLRAALASALAIPFWHAPALIHWAGQGVAHSLFSSAVAVWRSKGAFLLYGLAWAAALALVGTLLGLVFSLLGAAQLAGALVLPVGLAFSAAFYVSLWFTFSDSFSYTRDAAPEEAPIPPA